MAALRKYDDEARAQVLRHTGWVNIAAGVRHTGRDYACPLALLGIT